MSRNGGAATGTTRCNVGGLFAGVVVYCLVMASGALAACASNKLRSTTQQQQSLIKTRSGSQQLVTMSSSLPPPLDHRNPVEAQLYEEAASQCLHDAPGDVKLPAKSRKKADKSLFARVVPLFVIPFLVQSAILPLLLTGLKALLLKSILIGKLALFLIGVNMLRRVGSTDDQSFVQHYNTNRRMQQMAMSHYGYTGGEEYGAYMSQG